MGEEVTAISIIVHQQIQLILTQEEKRVEQVMLAEQSIVKSKRDRQQKQAAHFRLLAYEMWRMGTSLGLVTIWLLVGTVIGVIVGHNLLSRVVLCDQAMCEILRFDGMSVDEYRD